MRLGVRRHFECVYDLLGELFPLFINECRTRLSIPLTVISSISNELFINSSTCFESESKIPFYTGIRFSSTLPNELINVA